ncbi:MAG: hypothetical protein KDA25_06710, partial [Phycisphaerales bacterium]|nr:hypothetical protein [Phycisphaerales bacterium]
MVMVLGVRLAALLLVLSSPAFGAGRTTPTPEPDHVVSPPGPLTSLPAADSDPATPPADPVSPPDEQAADRVRESDPALVASDASVDALLDALERSGRDLTGFTADVVLHKWDGVTERREIRAGRFIYDANPETKRRRFAVLFDRTVVNNRQEDDRQHYIFADGWLVEVYAARKQFIKRQIVPPGQVFDPLRLGEGPFPLPIGQAKADVLRRFEVSAIPVPSEGLFANLKDV